MLVLSSLIQKDEEKITAIEKTGTQGCRRDNVVDRVQQDFRVVFSFQHKEASRPNVRLSIVFNHVVEIG